MDGVPAVSMCPIAPGSSYTYSFKATPFGTTWYHSHYSSQYAGGLWGPLVIYGPKNDAYDVDLGPITLNDYYHRDYFSVLQDVESTDFSRIRPASDNNLINGKMDFDCQTSTENNTNSPCVNNAGLSKFNFTSGKKHRLRLINTGVQAIQKFSIDGHTMTVIANDFIPITPYETTIVTLAVGQRSDVIVEATGKPTDIVWMRSKISSGGCTEPASQPLALATIYYEHANKTAAPPKNSTAQTDNTDPCNNDALSQTVPSYSISAGTPSTTLDLSINVGVNASGHFVWTINNSSFRGNFNNPLLLLSKAGNTSYPSDHPEWNVYNLGRNATIRVVLTNLSPASHPWHLHGHEMQVLAVGTGTWDGSTIVNQQNPQRRDVMLLPANGYLVLQWESNNPGVWPFHCHIAWHISGGLYANLLEQPDEIKKYNVPSTAYQNCRDWSAWSGGHLVDQIDSGL